ncbi:MAG: glutamate--tRNA ligase [Campylobacterota bacterium]|nr:glutamate--tRNA ligase [Campylobacterota bacterium]
MLRFSPSSTKDLSIGNLRVALFNYILSKQRDEELLVRIEDSNSESNIAQKDKEILAYLDLFGIEYSNVVYQSDNLKIHRRMAIQLLQSKYAFSCFCSNEVLQKRCKEAKVANEECFYDGTCSNLLPQDVIDNVNPFTIRIKKPDFNIEVDDLIKGKLSFTPNSVDSFIIMSAEKTPTYNFASSIDDMLADISLVIRDEEYLRDTPRQIAIRSALGYDKRVTYAHLPTISNGELISVKWLIEEGYLPSAIINYLLSIGNVVSTEIFTLKEAIEWFNIENISNSPVSFELEKLKLLNRAHLNMMDDLELSRYVGFADEKIGKLAKLYLKEHSTTVELKSKIEPIFKSRSSCGEYSKSVELLQNIIKKAPFFKDYDSFKKYLISESGLKNDDFLKSIRVVLTNAEDGPDLNEIYDCIKEYLEEIVK